MASISRRIRDLRIQHCFTQREFAEIAGVEQKTVQRWESGQSIPRSYSIQRLCLHFGTTPEALGFSDLPSHEQEETAEPSPTGKPGNETLQKQRPSCCLLLLLSSLLLIPMLIMAGQASFSSLRPKPQSGK